MQFRALFLLFVWGPLVVAQSNPKEISGWVKDPDGRGTFTMLSSCILTLSLCVYTAIHLNVRPYKQTELRSWIETTKWVFFGILAPELMVFVAWRQYISAKALDRIVRRLKDERAAAPSGQEAKVRMHGWSKELVDDAVGEAS
ncbi:MAG: hypothetical protein Q9178_007058 [Gyalolechia marmorata]